MSRIPLRDRLSESESRRRSLEAINETYRARVDKLQALVLAYKELLRSVALQRDLRVGASDSSVQHAQDEALRAGMAVEKLQRELWPEEYRADDEKRAVALEQKEPGKWN
jgi:hypothetical protein